MSGNYCALAFCQHLSGNHVAGRCLACETAGRSEEQAAHEFVPALEVIGATLDAVDNGEITRTSVDWEAVSRDAMWQRDQARGAIYDLLERHYDERHDTDRRGADCECFPWADHAALLREGGYNRGYAPVPPNGASLAVGAGIAAALEPLAQLERDYDELERAKAICDRRFRETQAAWDSYVQDGQGERPMAAGGFEAAAGWLAECLGELAGERLRLLATQEARS